MVYDVINGTRYIASNIIQVADPSRIGHPNGDVGSIIVKRRPKSEIQHVTEADITLPPSTVCDNRILVHSSLLRELKVNQRKSIDKMYI